MTHTILYLITAELKIRSMGHISPIKQRLNITFGKYGAIKYTSTLDIAKVWERVLRRAELPVLYTAGFNTRPRIQLASALSLGITSECEIIDVALREVLPTLDDILERLEAVSPDGLRMYDVQEVDINGPALQQLVRSAEYRIRLEDEADREGVQERVEKLLATEHIVKVKLRKKGRKTSYDMRPMIHDLKVDENDDLIAHIASGERGNLHPKELLEELGLGEAYASIHRQKLYIDDYYAKLAADRRDN